MVTKHPQVLLVSNRDDFTTDYIATLCAKRNCDYLRVNSEDIVETVFSFVPSEQVAVACQSTVYDLRNVRSVYFRRTPSQFPPIESEDASFIFRERREFLEGFLLTLDARWVNPLAQTILGERKTLQLSLAKLFGLRTPKTLITNDAELANDFVLTNKAIAKPVSHGFLQSVNGCHSIYTNDVSTLEFTSSARIMMAPMLLQEKIPNRADIRVTIVGEELFAVEIVKLNDANVDWRRVDVKKTYKIHTLTDDIAGRLISLHRHMGLVYSAMDLILTPSEEYVFLEVNPVGEWLWLELELGIPVSDRIMKQLML